ncbi:MAG: hypothetical protein QOG65_3372 [Actinomycetota bacterium]|jgi:hypothetical protein|nr:hypothetical protein [Actinomycetota bacterium]MDQ1385993.1 hypothetical protein [Actinomycetota bacterium]
MSHGFPEFRRSRSGRVLSRTLLALAVPAVVAALAAPAGACGGLVGENGSIKLTRTTTLAAYHDGVERYVTSFEFSGQGKSVGSITPLPGIPTKVERGGNWTLQRLEREVAPPVEAQFNLAARGAATSDSAVVILEKKIDALDITILKGGGAEVGKWAVDHGFLLTPDAPAMLDFYGRRSQIFMAARFDATRAQRLGQTTGDGTPIMLTIPVKEPWVPLHILSLGLDKASVVEADVFLLTDRRPKLLAGGNGLSLRRNESASASLLDDLRIDKGMGWVPQHMWFTYLRLNTPAAQLGYDLAVSDQPGAVPRLADTGVTAQVARAVVAPTGQSRAMWPLVAAVITGALTFGSVTVVGSRRRRRIAEATP